MKVKSKFVCHICEASFTAIGSFNIHENNIHKGVKFECEDCGKEYNTKSNLNTHVNTIHKGLKYRCGQCNKQFISPSGKFTHIKNVQERPILYHTRNLSMKVSSTYVKFAIVN